MPDEKPEMEPFENLEEEPDSLPHEFYLFLMSNKKFWLVPILLVLLVLGALIVLGGSSAAPFIYSLF